jgi:hypothetical protein
MAQGPLPVPVYVVIVPAGLIIGATGDGDSHPIINDKKQIREIKKIFFIKTPLFEMLLHLCDGRQLILRRVFRGL